MHHFFFFILLNENSYLCDEMRKQGYLMHTIANRIKEVYLYLSAGDDDVELEDDSISDEYT